MSMVCRQARKQYPALLGRPARGGAGTKQQLSITERAALEHHLQTCDRCALEYRIYALGQATLNAAASPETVTPDEDFFKALRARIARGPEVAAAPQQDESWAAALMAIARQMIPAMAMLLLLIISATFLWNSSSSSLRNIPNNGENSELTPDDVLESFVAVEERWDGR